MFFMACSTVYFTATGIFGADPAAAQDVVEPSVIVESAWLAATEEGGERLVLGPRPEGAGEQLVTVRFRLEGTKPAARLRIVLAIPDGMHYVAGSAVGPGAEISYSVDGGRSFGPAAALSLPVDAEDPDTAMRTAKTTDYSHIRWELPGTHPPGLAGLVSFRARLIERGPGPEPGADAGTPPEAEAP